ncbi:MAG: peptidyl-prolyl cis-trans isomerase [Desulfobacteraceae bacterium]|nr:peptidyl-prolyl cis-trans isomerase [Desulfobacteraceae bacterium]
MLRLMRDHASSWLIKVLLFAIVIVFVFWGVGSYKSRNASQLAEVNGDPISYEQYRETYSNLIERYRQQFGNSLNDQLLQMLDVKNQAVDQLVTQRLLLQEAKRLNIQVTNEELVDNIKEFPAFQSENGFDENRYRVVLNRVRMSPEQFEVSQREQLILNKLRQLVLDPVTVSDDEAMQWFNHDHTTVNIEYASFETAKHTDINPTPAELNDYFEKNKEKYKTEPKVKVNYIKFDAADYTENAEVSEDDIRNYYDTHPDEFETEKTIEARHILFKVDEGADQGIVDAQQQKAEEVHAMAVKGDDFAELAKEYSEGPSKDRGGYLGNFEQNAMVKPFADQAFSMKAGDISKPLRTQFGWHIIKVEKVNEAAITTFEDAADGIREKLLISASKNTAYDKALDVYDVTFEGDDLVALSKSQNLQVVTTGFFTRQGPEEGVGNRYKFAAAAFGLAELDISDVQDFDDGYYILQLIEKLEPEIPAFDTVSEKVTADLTQELQTQKAKSGAEAFLAALKEGARMVDLSDTHGAVIAETGHFKRADTIPVIGYEPLLTAAAFKLTNESTLPENVLKGSKGFYVIRLIERKMPDSAGFDQEKTSIKEKLQQQKETKTFEAWLTDLRTNSTISINREFLE